MGQKGEKVSSLGLLATLLNREAGDLTTVVLYGLGAGTLSLAIPIGVQTLVNTVTLGTINQPVVFLVLAVLAGLVVAAVLRTVQVVLLEKFQKRFFVRVALSLADRIPRFDMTSTRQGKLPELVNRFFDVLTVQKSAAHLLLEGVALGLQILFALLLLAFYHPALLAFALCLVVAIAGIVFILGKGAVDTSIQESVQKYRVAAYLEEVAGLPLTYRTPPARAAVLQKTNALLDEYLSARESHFQILLKQIVGSYSLKAIASAALLGLGTWLVIKQQLSIGQLVAAEIVVTSALSSLAKFQKHLESFYDLIAALDKIEGLLNLPLESESGEALNQVSGPAALELRSVQFRYPKATWSFSNLDLRIDPGLRVALLGSNGSGKSTLINLLYGLNHVESGVILFDAADFRTTAIEQLRTQISLARGIEFFSGTLIENIRAGRNDITLERIKTVLTKLDLMDDVLQLERGLHTVIDSNGSPLTISQLLRVTLARAVVGRPRLLLVDELLDSLDGTARAAAVQLLLDPHEKMTVLVSTHSPEIAKAFDETIHLSELIKGRAA